LAFMNGKDWRVLVPDPDCSLSIAGERYVQRIRQRSVHIFDEDRFLKSLDPVGCAQPHVSVSIFKNSLGVWGCKAFVRPEGLT